MNDGRPTPAEKAGGYFTRALIQPVSGELVTCPGPKVGPRRYIVELHGIVIRAGAFAAVYGFAEHVDAHGGTLVPCKEKAFGPREKPRNHIASFTPAGAAAPVEDPTAYFLALAHS